MRLLAICLTRVVDERAETSDISFRRRLVCGQRRPGVLNIRYGGRTGDPGNVRAHLPTSHSLAAPAPTITRPRSAVMSLNTTLDAFVLLGDSITEQSWCKEGLSSRLARELSASTLIILASSSRLSLPPFTHPDHAPPPPPPPLRRQSSTSASWTSSTEGTEVSN